MAQELLDTGWKSVHPQEKLSAHLQQIFCFGVSDGGGNGVMVREINLPAWQLNAPVAGMLLLIPPMKKDRGE